MPRGGQHRFHILDIAEPNYSVQFVSRNRNDERAGASCQQQAIIFRSGAIFCDDTSFDPINRYNLATLVEGDTVLFVPVEIVENNLVNGLLPAEYRGEKNTVIVAVRLITENRDLVFVGRQFQQLLQRSHAGHTIAYQYQPVFSHLNKTRFVKGSESRWGGDCLTRRLCLAINAPICEGRT